MNTETQPQQENKVSLSTLGILLALGYTFLKAIEYLAIMAILEFLGYKYQSPAK